MDKAISWPSGQEIASTRVAKAFCTWAGHLPQENSAPAWSAQVLRRHRFALKWVVKN
ncbi:MULTISPECIES: hypothetical protein [unclassified Pseudomonas]|uniref:hypothetical protein n=1 Tax=Pseudomonas TaxID=286 RepID=UPI001CC1BE58|nr:MULTISPECIES: hypothetical protein [unclassified Pseudomonas]